MSYITVPDNRSYEKELPAFNRTDNTAAGLVTIATATGDVRIMGFTLISNIDHTATDLTSITIECGPSQVNTIIAVADGVPANLDSDEAQVSMAGSGAGIVLQDGNSIYATFAGGGVNTVDVNVQIRYAPVTPGAILVAA